MESSEPKGVKPKMRERKLLCKLPRDVKSKRCKTRAGFTVKFLPMYVQRGVEVQLH